MNFLGTVANLSFDDTNDSSSIFLSLRYARETLRATFFLGGGGGYLFIYLIFFFFFFFLVFSLFFRSTKDVKSEAVCHFHVIAWFQFHGSRILFLEKSMKRKNKMHRIMITFNIAQRL